jgi:membrane-associated phospholipid phosphatase
MVRGQAHSPAFLIAVFAGGLVAPLGVFAALLVRAARDPSAGWEQDLIESLYARTSQAHGAMDALIDLAEMGGPVLVSVLVLGLLYRGHHRDTLFLVAAVAGAIALALAAKSAVDVLTAGASRTADDYPSGHAAVTTATVAAGVALLGDRQRLVGAALGAAFVAGYGLALASLNWHSPSEVVGGACLGVAWVASLWLGAALAGSWARGVRTPSAGPERAENPEHTGADARQERRLEPRA